MTAQDALNNVNTSSRPTDLMITDMRFTDITGAPMHCSLMKIYTNQGIVGMGEVRDGASKTYALMLKSRLLGQNPCNVDKIFRRIKQFGGMSRQAGGVCGVELALWDLAGKAYGVPVYQLLGGKFRQKVRVYCDTDISGKPDGNKMGAALKKRMEKGFTFLKMDLGLGELGGVPGTLNAPLGFMEQLSSHSSGHFGRQKMNRLKDYADRSSWYDDFNIAHPFTGIQLTEKGLDILEQYVAQVRSVIGYEIPLAIDHLGHIPYKDGLKLAKRIEKYNIAWMEDLVPWQLTDQYVELSRNTTIPICTGEDIYLKENFKPLLESGGVQIIHPDLLSSGGILENKKIGDMAQDYGVAMAVHMAESPVACLAAAHSVSATENFLALEFHSVDVPWWDDIVTGLPSPVVKDGFITLPEKPGLGIEDYNDEVLAEHIHPEIPGMWEPTSEWDGEWSHDRTWS